ncbi:protein translocase subunit SecF [Pajaroellobacter abortibovis]|uniref:Protein-export membrane protein SecF n=1 Tax=Pajaroellobacter abortibovis TaxID=1882918 RepID=A0A1L6MVI0_9BACT|nr:protein translocase subunit SecF [Pajaroellobacter abortibovis]APR99511.1 protein-export membrane protein SecF [Pajaroellobacter abortibovis]
MEFFKPGRQFDFMAQRKFWITFSIILSIGSMILCFYPGPTYGTDFRGGTEIEVAFLKPVDVAALRHQVQSIGFTKPDVVQVVDPQNPYRFLIRVPEITILDEASKEQIKQSLCLASSTSPAQDPFLCPQGARAIELKFGGGGDKIHARYEEEPDLYAIREQIQRVPMVHLRSGSAGLEKMQGRAGYQVEIQLQSKGDQIMEGLRRVLGAEVVPEQALRVEWVGPKAGKQLRDSARNSVALAIAFIMLYLVLRFDLRFAPGVVLACVHDTMVVLGVFIIFKKEITLSTIAAVLTVVGYSMNDTVVVYDRIRENLGKYRSKPFAEIINLSVSETLSRTLLTSGATILSVLAFFIWGTGVIKDFALAMVVGILAGTYSSIYVAAPLTEWIDSRIRRAS